MLECQLLSLQAAQFFADAIHETGACVKGVEPALLDFPAIRNGCQVYLCWREGEDRITHWHPMHTGFAGREELDPATECWEWCS